MNNQNRKQLYKGLLGLTALIIVTWSLIYTNQLSNKIKRDERRKVELWAEAIRKKANLVKYTNELFQKIGIEERKKVELWAEATKQLADANNIADYTFVLKVVADNTTVPVILTNEKKELISSRNIDKSLLSTPGDIREMISKMEAIHPPIEVSIYGDKKNLLFYQDSRLFQELKGVLDDLIQDFIAGLVVNSASVPVIFTDKSKKKVLAFGNLDSNLIKMGVFVKETLAEMERQNEPIAIDLGNGQVSYIYYKDSYLLTQLTYFPWLQLIAITLFMIVAYWVFHISRQAEQNQVWVGMAKETAHQLGTPLSSLMAWMELLPDMGVSASTIEEMNKDIVRLEMVTDRFSKIGSTPKLSNENLSEVLQQSVKYMRSRSSSKIEIRLEEPASTIFVKLNVPLFQWVVENLFKNAIDAMDGSGKIIISVGKLNDRYAFIDISDTGKGIASTNFKTVFKPGYTSKLRGWGLGLSLAKRIVESYHNGRIFVRHSEVGKGTTFRILVRNAE